MKLVNVAEMQAVEREADAAGLTYVQMMENAGRGLAEVLMEVYPGQKESGALGLVGSGNNGGDTLIALTIMAQHGWKSSVYLARPRPAGDPLLDRLLQAGGKIYSCSEDPLFETLATLLETHAVLLDGVLGTGARLPLKTEIQGVLAAARDAALQAPGRLHVVAVDCPSGIDCDSGAAAPECIPAELTVTMAAVKQGLLRFPAYNLVGALRVTGIGLPEDNPWPASWSAIRRSVVSSEQVQPLLPPRPLDSHKGTFGTALITAGSVNYTGAAWLAGQAAYRIGAGLVTLAVPAPVHSAIAGQFPEATWLLLPHEIGVIAPPAAELLIENLGRATALLLGPGFGLENATAEFMALLTGGTRKARKSMGFTQSGGRDEPGSGPTLPPLVIDADGLKLLARLPDWTARLPAPAVLTPHPGEMSVLTGLSKDEIQSDRLAIAERFSRQWGHVVVLKGAFTVIASPEGETAVIPVASPALAHAGTGDVLAGLITGLRAQGVAAFPAALAGAWIHAQAGLMAARRFGTTASVLAGDVLRSVPEVLSELQPAF